jgi:hypothetical protein
MPERSRFGAGCGLAFGVLRDFSGGTWFHFTPPSSPVLSCGAAVRVPVKMSAAVQSCNSLGIIVDPIFEVSSPATHTPGTAVMLIVTWEEMAFH